MYILHYTWSFATDPTAVCPADLLVSHLEMHDEIFHFEIFKNFMKILKYFKTPFLKYFMKFLIFNIK